MITVIVKHRVYGWKATTTIDLGNHRFLRIETSKDFDKIVSDASVSIDKGDGSFTPAAFDNYDKRVSRSDAKMIASEKAITNFHNQTLLKIDEIKKDVQKFYKIKLHDETKVTA